MLRHFTTLFELGSDEAHALLREAFALKAKTRTDRTWVPLVGRTLGLLFEKPSLRTRVSFEAAIAQLGGNAIFLPAKEVGLGERETIADFARVLSQYVDVLAARTFAQSTVEELARHATIPVINALSDADHPCQALGDLMTVHEVLGRTRDVRIVFVGDGNNVARALAVASALLDARFRLACPEGYSYPDEFRLRFKERFPNIELDVEHNAARAVADADVVYTDVWTSMGQEDELQTRRKDFAPFQVDGALMSRADKGAIFLHCLPAHRGEEVTSEILDGPRSFVIPQAANRLHLQKALLLWLLRPGAATVENSGTPKAARRPSKTG
jgi:ornithine carbamoyltransferase